MMDGGDIPRVMQPDDTGGNILVTRGGRLL